MTSKRLLNLFALILFSLNGLVQAGTYWDNPNIVRPYVHNSELQRRWAWGFLAKHMRYFQGDEKVLDIGCGDGKITADLAKFFPRGSVVGIDPSKPMISWAKRQYPLSDHPNLQFKDGSFNNTGMEEEFDLIVSCCAFQFCPDPQAALEDILYLLKPESKLLMIVPAGGNVVWNQILLNLVSSEKWGQYWKGYPFRKWRDADGYRELLIKAGFLPKSIEKVHTLDPFVDREEFVAWMKGTYPPVVPEQLQDEFYNEVIDEYQRLLPEATTEDGVINVQFGIIEIEAVRPAF